MIGKPFLNSATRIKEFSEINKELARTMSDVYSQSLELDMVKNCLKGLIVAVYVGFIIYIVLKKMGILASKKLKRF
jgi:hypothetical protein